MRDILFRGKPLGKLHNNFIYGSLGVISEDLCAIYHCHEFTNDDIQLVDIGTVGQYTGLTDKNGKNIFEGDIIIYGFKPCVVKWDNINACFSLYENGKTQISGFNADTMKLLEIIGNIYDNPELLKEA